jgi:hypothetical protein
MASVKAPSNDPIALALLGLVEETFVSLRNRHSSVNEFIVQRFESPGSLLTKYMLADLAAYRMRLTLEDNQGHSHASLDHGICCVFIHTIPVAQEKAQSWYIQEWGGYYNFLTRAMNNQLTITQKVLFDFIFGADIKGSTVSFWLSTCLFPLRPEHANLLGWWGLPMHILTDHEKRKLDL